MDTELLRRGELKTAAACFLFDGIEPEKVRSAAADERAELIELPKGMRLSEVTDYASTLDIVLAGNLRVTQATNDRFVMNVLRRGSVFGAANLYADGGSETSSVLTAETDTRLLLLPRSLVEELMRSDMRIGINLCRFLTGRIQFLNATIRNLAAEGAGAALSCWLRENARKCGDEYTVEVQKSFSDLAARLNIGRASLYRALDKFEQCGIIGRNGKTIILKDMDALI